MAKYNLEDLLAAINDDVCKNFVTEIHELLQQEKYKPNFKPLVDGMSATYQKEKVGKLKFSFNKKKQLIVRIYADYYANVLNSLPKNMLEQVANSPICKKAIDPKKCWDGCDVMYDFYIEETRHQKCRFDCFLFDVSKENIPHLRNFIKNEIIER